MEQYRSSSCIFRYKVGRGALPPNNALKTPLSAALGGAPDPQVYPMKLSTQRLEVVLQTREEVERMIDAMSEYDRAQISSDWLARFRTSEIAHPWVYAFRLVHRGTGSMVGTCSFKGPPIDGVVEIAYAIHSEHEGKGYATEAAQALIDYATVCGEVRLIRAHTLPGGVASMRVLEKCGFRFVGETVDPEDGTVSRFERTVGDSADAS